MYKIPIIFILTLLFSLQVTAQSNNSKWVVGIGGSLAKFQDADVAFIGDNFNSQAPRLSVSRYLFKGLTVDVGLSFSGIFKDDIPYFSFDTAVRYDFENSNESFVPYVLVGGSIVKTINKASPTFNLGFGSTYWLTGKYGLNTQLVYKHSLESFEGMRSHLHLSVGVVYSFIFRNDSDRLWNRN